MTAEFIDTNILIYAEDGGMGGKHQGCRRIAGSTSRAGSRCCEYPVLAEYYNAATKKLRMTSEEAEETIRDLAGWRNLSPRIRTF